MIMKDRYWHKHLREMVNGSLKHTRKIHPRETKTDFINFYQLKNRNLMRYTL